MAASTEPECQVQGRKHSLPSCPAHPAACCPAPLQECWQADPTLRPSMAVVVGQLGNIDRSCVMLDLDAQLAKQSGGGGGGCCVIS
jgi:hypothetical protein